MKYRYCEEGKSVLATMRKVYRMYETKVDEEQKAAGTDFRSWLDEMERMQILVKVV